MIVDIKTKAPKKRRSLKKRLAAAAFVLCLIAALCAVYIDRRLLPLLVSTSVANAEVIATRSINEAINEKMSALEVSYDELVTIKKDAEGRIIALTADTIRINAIEAELSMAVLDKIGTVQNTVMDIPIGNLLGGSLFLGRGPKLKIKLSTVGSVLADVDNIFISAGINQTRHQMILRLTATVGIILPHNTEYAEVTAGVVIAETVLLGTVPFLYADMNKSG